ncbi:hypothetical protein U9M48_007042 [Paspalum notatum var. saurae]|uniref:Protein kinase domain-containing protein n=1 Tax=Paspalum notatum var. saurae TaxID=547442 RepID=A0AAQ3PZU9_PASNO
MAMAAASNPQVPKLLHRQAPTSALPSGAHRLSQDVICETVVRCVVTVEARHAYFITNQGSEQERNIHGKIFTYQELIAATDGFTVDTLLGQGGFGQVYKGFLDSTNQVLAQEVAVKRLDIQGQQGNREFVTEVLMLDQLDHPNLIKLVGYCSEHCQRILVYEYMPLGSLHSHIHDLPPGQQPLDWTTRIKILLGAAKGLEHLHHTVYPPIINRDVKCSNILLGEGYHPKLSDFGLAKLGPTGDNTHVSTRVMGTAGYCAPEYLMSGKLTKKSDIYSFGVVMLEVLTGRMARDERLPEPMRNLTVWLRLLFSGIQPIPWSQLFQSQAANLRHRKDATNLVDPALQGPRSATSVYQAFYVAGLCVSESPVPRPDIRDVVTALSGILESIESRRRRSLGRRGPSTPARTSSASDGSQAQGQGQGGGS